MEKLKLNTMNTKIGFKEVFLLIIIGLLLSGCNNTESNPKESPKSILNNTKSLNVLILLDLSDRIVVQEGQIDRDKELLKHIASEMVNVIRENRVDESKEIFKISIAEQNNIPYSTLPFHDSLYFKMSKDIRGGIPTVKKILEGRFARNIDRLYNIANFSNNCNDYSGANISRYFIKDLYNDVKRDSLTTNLLFILTDGYVVVGNKTSAMLNVHHKIPELKVMVLEFAPRKKDYESERIIKSWDNWFEQIGIGGYTIRNIGPINAVKDDITKFLKGNLELHTPGNLN